MTGKERIANILRREPVDRIGLYEHFWHDTRVRYAKEGHIKEEEDLDEHFGFDMSTCWAINLTLDMEHEPLVISEDENTITTKDGNGATLRRHKHHVTTPEHIDFDIKESGDWNKAKHLLERNLESRIDFEGYRKGKAAALRAGRFFAWSGSNVFGHIASVCGQENMLYGMAIEPGWFAEMARSYAQLTTRLLDILFEREGKPDGIFYYDDLGYKGKTFISPNMYRELVKPAHIHTFDHARACGLPVILHSCGFIETLIPDFIEAGIDCLQAIEVKAGNDLLRIHREHGSKIALMGGIDVRALYSNDGKTIDEELERIIPVVKQGYGYIAHSDHSIPDTVSYESLAYYFKRVIELGRY